MNTVHKNIPLSFSCEFCQKKFNIKRSLNLHQSKGTCFQKEEAQKPKCDVCDLDFVSNQSLIKHNLSIHGEGKEKKKSECSVCKNTFKEEKALRIHFENVHGSGVVKKFKCGLCFKAYQTKQGLTIHHQIIHEEKSRLMCDICKKSYATAKSLTAVC